MKLRKWFTCFIAWENDNGGISLSIVPWYILIKGIFNDTGNFKWVWVPPWKIKTYN